MDADEQELKLSFLSNIFLDFQIIQCGWCFPKEFLYFGQFLFDIFDLDFLRHIEVFH